MGALDDGREEYTYSKIHSLIISCFAKCCCTHSHAHSHTMGSFLSSFETVPFYLQPHRFPFHVYAHENTEMPLKLHFIPCLLACQINQTTERTNRLFASLSLAIDCKFISKSKSIFTIVMTSAMIYVAYVFQYRKKN